MIRALHAKYDPQQNTNKTPDQIYIEKVLDAQENRNYTNALHMLNEMIQYEEWQLQFMYQLRADCHFEFKEYEKARDEYIKSLPEQMKGISSLGLVKLMLS